MRRYFLRLSYLGTAYHGWQKQDNAASIQESIEKALGTILRQQRVPITGCGRTDTGVHASNFIAHFDTEVSELDTLVFKLNSLLSNDIVIHELIPVAADAHARFDASSREYVYRMHVGKNPFRQHYSSSLRSMPDIDLMNQAGQLLIDASDFSSFAKTHTDVKTHICDVTKAEWQHTVDGLEFRIAADRFLRNMVRAIVGTLLEVGRGKMTLDELQQVIEAKDRSVAGTSVPAVGLSLCRIDYPYLQRP